MTDETASLDDRQHLYRLLYQDIGICGCGNPEDAYALIRGILELAPLHQDWRAARALFGDGPGSGGAYHVVLSVLTNAKLLEHGGGIGGSWLTGKGKHYRDLMQRCPWEAIEDDDHGVPVGFPHDGKDCPEDCRHRQAAT